MELELIEPSVMNMQHAWIPLVGAGLLVFAGIAAILTIVNVTQLRRSRKICNLVLSIFWTVLYICSEIFLFVMANDSKVTGSFELFTICSACLCLGGLIALGSRVWSTLQLAQNQTIMDEQKDEQIDEHNENPTAKDKQANEPNEHESKNKERLSHLLGKARSVFNIMLEWTLPLLSIGIVTLLCFIFLELPSNSSLLEIVDPYMNCEITIIASVVAGAWLIFQRHPVGFIISMTVAFVYGLAEYFVELFKGAAIMPSDLRSLNTGMNVANNYQYEITTTLLIVISLFALSISLVTWLKDPLARILAHRNAKKIRLESLPFSIDKIDKHNMLMWARDHAKNVVVAALSIMLGIYLITTPLSNALKIDWAEEGIEFDYWSTHESIDEFGIIPSFIAALQLEEIKQPLGYTHKEAQQLEDGLTSLYNQIIEPSAARQEAKAQFEQIKPNVVLVMNESFSDLSFLGGLGVGYAGPQFLSSMDAIARGKASVSVYGGSTCNSEFESLSGINLGYIAGAINPYVLYDLSQINSIPKQFKAMGYQTTAIHPENATNWSRDSVYPAIGFDQFIDGTAFEDAELVREHVSDAATYEMVLKQLADSDEPQFVFDLTMMGHGGYKTGLIPANEQIDYDFSDVLERDEADAVNEYLSSIKMSDEDLQGFISALKDFDEPTVVVFFGDHEPGISWYFKEQFADDSTDINYQESMYQTDYFIWSNYDIAGSAWSSVNHTKGNNSYPDIQNNAVEYRGSMASSMLMSWALSYIGAPLNDFEKASYVSRAWLQSTNLFGYMDAIGTWHPASEADEVPADTVFEQGETIIQECAEAGALPDANASVSQAAVMSNVMKWITYLNFIEKLK